MNITIPVSAIQSARKLLTRLHFERLKLPVLNHVLATIDGAIARCCATCARARPSSAQKRTARLLAESGLPETKPLSTLEEALLPAKVRRQLPALIEGGFVDRAVNVLAFGLPGRGKTHFLATLGRELILRHSKRVLFRPTFKLAG